MIEIHQKLEQACREARDKFAQLDSEGFKGMIEKLDYLIVSYNADQNPIGLYEVGQEAIDTLKAYKVENPRKVAQKLIDGLEKAVSTK
ncbi:MAG: hypothetical protein MUE85_21240 [Microscillaceae bacterium]|jgi:hypothetical protein|nr:hypothetical protein [Microscillaceae bacterium]